MLDWRGGSSTPKWGFISLFDWTAVHEIDARRLLEYKRSPGVERSSSVAGEQDRMTDRTHGSDSYWLAGPPINFSYSDSSEGEHIISLTSKLSGCKLNFSLSRATHGLVYILGSSIMTVSSR